MKEREYRSCFVIIFIIIYNREKFHSITITRSRSIIGAMRSLAMVRERKLSLKSRWKNLVVDVLTGDIKSRQWQIVCWQMSGPPRDSDPRTRHMVLYKKKKRQRYKRWPAVTASSRSDINGDQTPHILCRLCPRCVYILVRHYVPVIMCTHTPLSIQWNDLWLCQTWIVKSIFRPSALSLFFLFFFCDLSTHSKLPSFLFGLGTIS